MRKICDAVSEVLARKVDLATGLPHHLWLAREVIAAAEQIAGHTIADAQARAQGGGGVAVSGGAAGPAAAAASGQGSSWTLRQKAELVELVVQKRPIAAGPTLPKLGRWVDVSAAMETRSPVSAPTCNAAWHRIKTEPGDAMGRSTEVVVHERIAAAAEEEEVAVEEEDDDADDEKDGGGGSVSEMGSEDEEGEGGEGEIMQEEQEEEAEEEEAEEEEDEEA